MGSKDLYDKQGGRITYDQWEKLFADHEYSYVGFEDFEDRYIVTRWVGWDYDFIETLDRPIIFISLIFERYYYEYLSEETCVPKIIYRAYYYDEKGARNHHELLTFLADQKRLDEFIKGKYNGI